MNKKNKIGVRDRRYALNVCGQGGAAIRTVVTGDLLHYLYALEVYNHTSAHLVRSRRPLFNEEYALSASCINPGAVNRASKGNGLGYIVTWNVNLQVGDICMRKRGWGKNRTEVTISTMSVVPYSEL